MATIPGSSSDDTLLGTIDDDLITGLAGFDTLFGSDGADTMDGGGDYDMVHYDASGAAVTVNLATGLGSGGQAAGDSYISIEDVTGSHFDDVITGNDLDNVLFAGDGNDTLAGAGGADSLYGGADDDLVDGGTGNDSLDGGTGTNTLDFSGAASFVRINLTSGLTSGGLGADQIANFQNMIGSDHNDSLTGDALDNVFFSGLGADTMIGNLGNDTADYSLSSGDVRVSLASGIGTRNAAQGDLLTGIENLIGSAFNDSLTGDTGDNVLTGNDGNDSLLGGDGADTIYGGTGSADSMTGGNGDDTYYVDSTGDKISEGTTGGTGDLVYSSATYTLSLNVEDLILTGTGNLNGTGNSGANELTGTIGDNSLAGGSGNDAVIGSDGDDTLNGESGVDTMTGGSGDDAYFIDNPLDIVTELADEGNDTVNSTVTWTLAADFEHLTLIGSTGASGTGNALDNEIKGNIGSNLLQGLGGDDNIVGDFTSSTLSGGNDTLDGGAGNNTLIGGLGSDTYLVTTGTDTILENLDSGTDTVFSDVSITLASNVENLVLNSLAAWNGIGNTLDNMLTGNDSNNEIAGLDGADTLIGGIGSDTMFGGTGIDSMVGGTGDDDYVVDDAADKTIEGAAAGLDQVYASVNFTLTANLEEIYATGANAIDLTGNTLDNILSGNAAANILNGGSGVDRLYGGDGNDGLIGESGDDSMAGNVGDDTYMVDSVLDLTIELANEGADTVLASVNWTLADNTESLILTGTTGLSGIGNDVGNTITGTTGANLLSGLGGADTLNGGDGNDSLIGGAGIDSLAGGLGDDIYTLSTADDVVNEALNEGIDTVRVDFTYTLGDNVERLIMTGSADLDATGNTLDNVLTANGGVNILSGLGGNDTLIGGGGADTIIGGEGADSMAGGAGADRYSVDNLGDKVIEISSPQIDTVVSSVSFSLGAYVENLELTTGILDATGNSIANTLTGTTSANVLSGLGGNDTLHGLAGTDTLDGGIGNDTMIGGNGNDVYRVNSLLDVVDETGTNGIDRVESAVNYTLGGGLEHLTLTGANRVNATGNSFNNIIIGNDNNNKLSGLEGDDTLTGGLGADSFVFTAGVNGLDTITDFNGLVSGVAEGDKMQVALSLLVGTFDYVGVNAFTGGSDNSEARVNIILGRVLVDFDGDGSADLTIALTGLNNEDQLAITDFTFL